MAEELQWYKTRGYQHFDTPISKSNALRVVSNPAAIARHGFLPFIKFVQAESRFDREKGEWVEKARPIMYASHVDSHIYAYYAYLLNKLYESRICSSKFSDSVIAYRKFQDRKCNIHFARDAILEIEQRRNCTAIALDIEKFFDRLDHKILKEAWCELIEKPKLPPDHYAVYKAITRFTYVNRNDLYEEFEIGRSRAKHQRMIGCSPDEFRKRVRGKGLIKPNPEIEKGNCRGIPQGSPISALLSNIYMFQVDRRIHEIVEEFKSYYLRYSDDILVICPTDYAPGIETKINTIINEINLTISKKKREITTFVMDKSGSIKCIGTKPLKYLGFTFDGQRVLIRDSSIQRYYRHVRRAKRSVMRAAEAALNKGRSGIPYKRKLFRRYSHLGRRSFPGYVLRASRIMDRDELKKQISKHWKVLTSDF